MRFNKTPLRYPGGKQKLTPFILELLKANCLEGGHYAEAYAGGAGVALYLLLEKHVEFIHLNDSDYGIYAFWHSVKHHPEEFCRMILTASLTIEEWKRQKEILKNQQTSNLLELGFAVFFLNRCNRSGVLSGGVIGGLDQSGTYKMDARFSRNDLIRRIEVISLYSDKIHISNLDAEDYIENYIPNLPDRTLVYLDPPYFEKGSKLYLNAYKKSDHERLATKIQNRINHHWVLSYDGVQDIIKFYTERRHFLYQLHYNASRVYEGDEVFVFSDRIKIPSNSSLPHIQIGLEKIINS